MEVTGTEQPDEPVTQIFSLEQDENRDNQDDQNGLKRV
jgi:hypothetical protein